MSSGRRPGLAWLREHDRGFAALRRAGRTAVVMPAMFALGSEVIGNPHVATFAAFGILFAGVVSSVLAAATTTLLLAFILPVSLPGMASSIPDRVAGWGL